MTKQTIDIILPAYHEQENIQKVITNIEKYVKTPHEITVVLQDRNDPTLKIITKFKKEFKNLNIIFTKNGIGMLKALKEGFKQTKAPIITVMMADLSDDARDIDKMAEQINKGFDLVCASRYTKKGKRNGGPVIKGFLSYLACKSLSKLIGLPTQDATNAFKTFRRPLLKRFTLESKEGFELPLELTVKTFHTGGKITEIPTIWNDRKKGRSKFYLFKNIPLYLKWYKYGITQKRK